MTALAATMDTNRGIADSAPSSNSVSSSSIKAAFNLPAHAFYIADPHHLSVLSLSIDATATISTSRASFDPNTSQSFVPSSSYDQRATRAHGHRHASFSKPSAPRPPPSAFDPSAPRPPKQRPISLDFGSKAKEAFQEIGKFASRKTNAFDRANGAEALAKVANSLTPSSHLTVISPHQNSPSSASSSRDKRLSRNSQLSSAKQLTSDDATVVTATATRTITLKPHSFTFGSDSRLTSPIIPLGLDSSTVLHPGGRSERDNVEFIADPASTPQASAAGIFSAEIFESDDEPAPLHPSAAPPSPSFASSFEPSRLLLKVKPPAGRARKSWSAQTTFLTLNNAHLYSTLESHKIVLRFRLRLGAAASAASPDPRSFRHLPASGPPRQILFLSADSPQRLMHAIESPHSTVSTPELALLEGISCVELNSPKLASDQVARGGRDCDFEWVWKPLGQAASRRQSKCCCAFVELDGINTQARILAAFHFWIDLPSSSSNAIPSTLDKPIHAGPMERFERTDSIDLIAALNHELETRDDLFDSPPQPRTNLLPPPSPSTHDAIRLTVEDSPSQGKSQTLADPAFIPLDRTELTLDDLKSDSPIFRAALSNLEKKTANLKRLSKTAFKAAFETRTRILRLIEADEVMGQALDHLAAIAPDTIGQLNSQVLVATRQKNAQLRREQATMIQQNLEQPLAQVADVCRMTLDRFKAFEAESKAYYSSTQKWLSNRATADVPSMSVTTTNQSNASSDRMHKKERSDEKQKLRELQFEQARLDLFTFLYRLHGGRIEAQLVQCILKMCMSACQSPNQIWGPEWPSQAQSATLTTLSRGLEAALAQHESQRRQLDLRNRDLMEKIRTLEAALGKATLEVDHDGLAGSTPWQGGEAELMPFNPATTNAPVPSSKGRKLKNFLGAISNGIQGSPIVQKMQSNSPAPEASASEATDLACSSTAGSNVKRRVSLKMTADRNRPQSQIIASPLLPSQPPSSWNHNNLLVSSSNQTDDVQASLRNHQDHAQPHRDQSASRYASGPVAVQDSLVLRQAGRDAAASSIPNPNAADQGSEIRSGGTASGLGITTSSSAPSDPAEPAPDRAGPSSAQSAAAPTVSGGERKKEGVLWVLSKSITGPAGADAPRAVNRSAHWRECWVVLSGSGQISEFVDWKNAKKQEPTNSLIDLRFATVREARGVDRRFAFEIVTRDHRRFFQAPDEESMKDWMRAISKAIESLLNGTSSVRKLDRAVRASPFKSSNHFDPASGLNQVEEDPSAGEGNDFGVRKLLDGNKKSFTQSMTDLSASASGHGKEARSKSGHLATLSEAYTDSTPKSSKRRSKHERGISNKTPISGYLGGEGLGLSDADCAALHGRDDSRVSQDGSMSSASAGGDTEFDRNIEALIHRSYGSQDDGKKGHTLSSSPTHGEVSEMGMLRPRENHRSSSNNHSTSQPAGVMDGTANTSASTKISRAAEVGLISRQPGNTECADCRDPSPRWASWMLANEPCCIFICIGCSGVHRSLGVHISKVKSVDLDDWTEQQLQAARDWGNAKANAVWEYSKPAGLVPAAGDRKDFWQNKYVEAKWKRPTSLGSSSSDAATKPASKDIDATPTNGNRKPRALHIAAPPQRQASGSSKDRDGPSSPRPSGPRPLPSQRSASMTSVPAYTSPRSTAKVDQFGRIEPGEFASSTSPSRSALPSRMPASPSFPNMLCPAPSSWKDGNSAEPYAHAFPPDEAKSRRRMSRSLAAADGFENDHSEKTFAGASMLDVRGGLRPFPMSSSSSSRHSPRLSTSPSSANRKSSQDPDDRVSSPPSSYFVSNLDGPSPSPVFHSDASQDSASDSEDPDQVQHNNIRASPNPTATRTWNVGSNFDSGPPSPSPSKAPARFEPLDMNNGPK